jgi:hypothetical protein
MLIHEPDNIDITTVGFTGFATLAIRSGILNTLAISPPNDSLTYDITITNNKGFVVFDVEGVSGDYSERPEVVFRDDATLTITTSEDGEFNCYVGFVESYG